MKVTPDFFKKLSVLPLFENATAGAVKLALSDDKCVVKVFNSGECIYASGETDVALGIILRGKAEVFSCDPTKDVLLRTITVGDMVGVSKLFDDRASFNTRVFAKGSVRVLFVSEEALGQLLENDKWIVFYHQQQREYVIDLLSDQCRKRILQ